MGNVGVKRNNVPQASLPTRFGEFEIFGFESESDGEQAVALVRRPLDGGSPPLVRIHSQCLTGDLFHSLRCDCGDQLEKALSLIASNGGVLIYQMQEGRGIGLLNKLRAYQLQDQGIDTVEANVRLGFEADQRSYRFCGQILKYFSLRRIRLLSNNPAKIRALEGEDIQISERVPLIIKPSALSEKYLRTKKEKLGHLLD
ncbi:MAG: GTP cyclohydrolase II [Acidobacteriota bacterium]